MLLKDIYYTLGVHWIFLQFLWSMGWFTGVLCLWNKNIFKHDLKLASCSVHLKLHLLFSVLDMIHCIHHFHCWSCGPNQITNIIMHIYNTCTYHILRHACQYRALQFIPALTSPWLVRKHFLLANKRMLLAIIRTIYLQYVFICT